jgi:Ni,Fe-hydrogenase I large subunit
VDGSQTVSERSNGGIPIAGLNFGGINPPDVYSVDQLVDATLTALSTLLPIVGPNPSYLVSTLGRHAARALECKLLADAMADTPDSPAVAWLKELTTNGLSQPVYVYAKLPKKPKTGSGWAEAPRGALGHWISIDKKRIDAYQCVVPSTWNHSPRDDAGNPGAAESVLEGATLSGTTDQQVLDVLRLLHPYDFCIACAVHMVRPDGSTIAKVKMDLDGKVTKLPNDAEI